MGITEWVAVLVIFAVVYCLIKRYETRLVLIGSGLLLCLISWNLVGGLNAFAKSMTNASLVMAICGSMGFAFVAKYTEADRSLVHYLSAPIRGLGIFLVPVCTAITFFVNIAIPSAAGCAAAVGSTLIPVMLRAGITVVLQQRDGVVDLFLYGKRTFADTAVTQRETRLLQKILFLPDRQLVLLRKTDRHRRANFLAAAAENAAPEVELPGQLARFQIGFHRQGI